MNSKKIAHITHHDLDALGCLLCTEEALKRPQEVFSTNYIDIEEKVSDVCDYCIEEEPDLLLITDISFANNKHLLLKLQSLQDSVKIIFIDHHEYPEKFFDDITIKYFHDITKSATKITSEVFKIQNENLLNLVDIINSFDIWKSEELNFDIALVANEYFWKVKEKLELHQMVNSVKNNNYRLPNFKEFFTVYNKKMKEFTQKLRDKKLIMSDGFFTVIFTDEFFTQITYDEMKRGVEFVMICNSFGIIRYRIKSNGILSREQKEEIKMKLINNLDIGHLNAFSIKIQNSNLTKIMNKVQEVQAYISKFKPL